MEFLLKIAPRIRALILPGIPHGIVLQKFFVGFKKNPRGIPPMIPPGFSSEEILRTKFQRVLKRIHIEILVKFTDKFP